MSDGTKKLWLSKTMWLNLIGAALAMFYPPAAEWIAANVEVVGLIWGGLNMILRLITKEKVVLID